MTALENQNAAFNELQKDAKEQLIQHRKEFDRLSKDIKKSDKLAERIAKLTKDLNTAKKQLKQNREEVTKLQGSSKSTEELTDQLSIAQVQLNQQKSAMDSLIREKNGLIHQVNEIRDSTQLSVQEKQLALQEKELEITELRHELRSTRR